MNWLPEPGEEDHAEHFTAQAFMNYVLGSRGLTFDDLSVRPVMTVTFQPYIYQQLLRATAAEEVEAWSKINGYPLAHGRFGGRDLSIARLPVGAPAAIWNLEMLIAGGMRTLIAVGAAGSLQEHAPIGSAVLPTSAVREEGTSYHYAPAGMPALPDPDALGALRAACASAGLIAHEGPAWTTDAPFRELTSKVRRMAAGGVVAVDMEASALFIVGALREVRVASLFVVSDELFHPWSPAFFDRQYRAAADRIAGCALSATAALAADGGSLPADRSSPPDPLSR